MRSLRPTIAALAILFQGLGCSRPPTEAAPPATRIPALSAPAPLPLRHAGQARHGEIELPLPPSDPDTPRTSGYSLAPGQPPSDAHPAGTVFVTGAMPGQSLRLQERDLETGAPTRETALPVPPDDGNAIALPSAEGFHVVSYRWNGALHYTRLDASFGLVHRASILQLGPSGPSAFAGDSRVAVLVAEGEVDAADGAFGPNGTHVVSFDPQGRELGRTSWIDGRGEQLSTSGMRRNLVVSGGRAYLLLAGAHDSLALLALDARAQVVRRLRVPSWPGGTAAQATLHLRADHLEIARFGSTVVGDVPFDLDGVREHERALPTGLAASPACSDATSMGEVDAVLCWRGERLFVEWEKEEP